MSMIDKIRYIQWLEIYDWQWFATLTFRFRATRSTALRLFHKWIGVLERSQGKPISWVRAVEYGSEDGRLHLHVVLAGVHGIDIKWAGIVWSEFAGHAQIGAYDDTHNALGYTLKSIGKSLDADIDFDLHPEHEIGNSDKVSAPPSSPRLRIKSSSSTEPTQGRKERLFGKLGKAVDLSSADREAGENRKRLRK